MSLAALGIAIFLPGLAWAAGPTLTLYRDTNQLVVSAGADDTIINLTDNQDVQAVRLGDDNQYYIVVLVQQAHRLSLQLYTASGLLLNTTTALTLSGDKTVSVSKLDYDTDQSAIRVRANIRNGNKKPIQLITKWFDVAATQSLITVIEADRQKIHYPKKKLQQDNPTAGLAFLNWERSASGLLPVERNSVLDDTCALHAEYMRLNDTITHYEEDSLPGYTADGYTAGTESNLTSQYNTSFYNGVDILTTAVYHRLPMLRNNLHHIGWAISDLSEQGFRYGCLNVYGAEAWDVTYSRLQASENYATLYDPDNHEPLAYPGIRQNHVPIDFITGENPDPLADFGGTYPSGYPISLIFPYDDIVTEMSVQLLDPAGNTVDGYFREPNDVTDPNTESQQNAVTFIPLAPLQYGKTYQVKVAGRRNGENYAKKWKFITEQFDENYPWDSN